MNKHIFVGQSNAPGSSRGPTVVKKPKKIVKLFYFLARIVLLIPTWALFFGISLLYPFNPRGFGKLLKHWGEHLIALHDTGRLKPKKS